VGGFNNVILYRICGLAKILLRCSKKYFMEVVSLKFCGDVDHKANLDYKVKLNHKVEFDRGVKLDNGGKSPMTSERSSDHPGKAWMIWSLCNHHKRKPDHKVGGYYKNGVAQ
jgi:hypothetical protein